MKAIPLDYDKNPDRFRANVKAVDRYALEGDVHEAVAERLVAESSGLILDLGCGEGRFLQPARVKGLYTIAFDYSATMLKAVAEPRVQGDARQLPFPHDSFSAIVALYMLYHLPDPREAIAESQRILHPGGLFVACAPSRFNDPELASVLSSTQHTFDAENGLEMIQDYFQDVQVERWDAPLVHLPDREALTLYLKGRQMKAEKIHEAAQHLQTPLTLTKRGALFVGRNRVS